MADLPITTKLLFAAQFVHRQHLTSNGSLPHNQNVLMHLGRESDVEGLCSCRALQHLLAKRGTPSRFDLLFCLQDHEVEGGQVESIKDELLGAGDVVLVEVDQAVGPFVF